jgi:Bacterial capsule synthesis protein PGA_cap
MGCRLVLSVGLFVGLSVSSVFPVGAQTTPASTVSTATTSTVTVGSGAASSTSTTVGSPFASGQSTSATVGETPPSSQPPIATIPSTTSIFTTSSSTTSFVPTSTPATITPTTPTTSTPNATPSTGDAPRENWTVYFGGDTLLTRRISASTNPFARIRPPLDQADLTIVNVETAIATIGKAQVKTFTFLSDLSLPSRLASAGVDVVSLANNHAIDYGKPAMLETAARLRDAKVTPVGAGRNLKEALTPAELIVGGQRVAVFGASQIIPAGSWVATSSQAGIASAGKHVIDRNTENLLNAVRAAKATNDVVFVVLHWGIEGDFCPSSVQRQLGGRLRAAGATAVLGAHPHVLQPIVVDEKASVSSAPTRGLIAYSMGNFIWDIRSGASGETGLLELRFNGADLVGHEFHPHRLDSNGWAAAVDPTSPAGKRISARVANSCPGAKGSMSF